MNIWFSEFLNANRYSQAMSKEYLTDLQNNNQ